MSSRKWTDQSLEKLHFFKNFFCKIFEIFWTFSNNFWNFMSLFFSEIDWKIDQKFVRKNLRNLEKIFLEKVSFFQTLEEIDYRPLNLNIVLNESDITYNLAVISLALKNYEEFASYVTSALETAQELILILQIIFIVYLKLLFLLKKWVHAKKIFEKGVFPKRKKSIWKILKNIWRIKTFRTLSVTPKSGC